MPAGSCTHEPRGLCDCVAPLVPVPRPARAKVCSAGQLLATHAEATGGMATAMTSHNRWCSRAVDDWRWGVRRLKDPSRTKKDRRVYPSKVSQAGQSTMVLASRERPSGGGYTAAGKGFLFFLQIHINILSAPLTILLKCYQINSFR